MWREHLLTMWYTFEYAEHATGFLGRSLPLLFVLLFAAALFGFHLQVADGSRHLADQLENIILNTDLLDCLYSHLCTDKWIPRCIKNIPGYQGWSPSQWGCRRPCRCWSRGTAGHACSRPFPRCAAASLAPSQPPPSQPWGISWNSSLSSAFNMCTNKTRTQKKQNNKIHYAWTSPKRRWHAILTQSYWFYTSPPISTLMEFGHSEWDV